MIGYIVIVPGSQKGGAMHSGSSNATETAGKTCIYCGEDCSNRPRVRDRQGRYACHACVKAASRQWESHCALSHEVNPEILLAPEPELPPEVVRVDCPICLREIRPPETRCERCNYDSQTGLTPETLVGLRELGPEALICVKCKYDLRGLKQMRCPECGEPIRPRASKVKKAGRFKDEATRQAYRAPLLMIGIAGTVYVLWAGALGGPLAIPAVLLYLAFQVITGVIVFFLCSVIAFGFDAPWHLTFLRLTGIYCVVNLASLAISVVVGGSIILNVVVLLVFIQMLMSFLELDLVQAIGLGFALFIFRVVLVVGLVAFGMTLI